MYQCLDLEETSPWTKPLAARIHKTRGVANIRRAKLRVKVRILKTTEIRMNRRVGKVRNHERRIGVVGNSPGSGPSRAPCSFLSANFAQFPAGRGEPLESNRAKAGHDEVQGRRGEVLQSGDEARKRPEQWQGFEKEGGLESRG